MNDNPKIIISSYTIPIPPKKLEMISEQILRNENVGTILNVANDIRKTESHDKMYEKLGIKYIFLGINDELNYPPPEEFLDKVLDIYSKHDKEKTFLVNCRSGINRSALAVAGILWKTEKWKSPIEMIEYMRDIQIQNRGLWLLNNETFVEYLLKWCENNLTVNSKN